MSFINYSNIVGYVEAKINAINTLSANEAALVAAMANLLAGRNNPPSNMLALQTYLQGKESLVTDADLVKDVTLLLGASLPSKNTVWRMREFLSNDNFTVPLNIAGDVVYVTGCGGGPSGMASASTLGTVLTIAGWSATAIRRRAVQVVAGDVIPVVIGAGGVAASVTHVSNAALISAGPNAGANSSFGTLVIAGGTATRGSYRPAAQNSERSEWNESFPSGINTQNPSFGNAIALGSPAGPFGSGQDGVTAQGVNATGLSASDNSGAAGGNVSVLNNTSGSLTATSGAGGSGRIIVEWQEFV